MVEIASALVLIACIAGWLVNKKLDQDHAINTKSVEAELSAAIETALTKYNDRINVIFEKHGELKQSFESLKLQIGLRNR